MSPPFAADKFIGLTPDWWTAIGTGALAVIALVTAWVAIAQIREARSSGRDAMRAYVSANFELHPHSHHVIEFVVRNGGRTAATDVQFEWVGKAPERAISMASPPFAHAKFFEGIPTMAPGQEVRTFFDTTVARLNADGIEHRFSIKVTYTDRFGEPHTDPFNLDTEIYRGMTYAGTKNIDHVGKALETIANEIKGSHIGRGQLHVITEARAHWLARLFTRADGLSIRSKRRRSP